MAKESLIRKKAIEILQKQKFICWWPPKIKFRQTDIFGILDLIALRGRKLKCIQLTTPVNLARQRKKILNFFKKNRVKLAVEIWAWSDKKRKFKIETV